MPRIFKKSDIWHQKCRLGNHADLALADLSRSPASPNLEPGGRWSEAAAEGGLEKSLEAALEEDSGGGLMEEEVKSPSSPSPVTECCSKSEVAEN